MDPCFPTNVSDFMTIAGEGYTFVDKTLMIKDIVSFKNGPFLFTRPRRFGKTMNLSMLHCFFDIYAKGKDGRPGILMELKYSDKECDLDRLAEEALKQIRETDYSRNIDECHIEAGIAFRKHTARIAIGNQIPPKA